MTPATTIVEEPLDYPFNDSGPSSYNEDTPKEDVPAYESIKTHVPATPQNSAINPNEGGVAEGAANAQVPPGLKDLLLNFTISVLRSRPLDLLEHAQTYFTDLRSAAMKKVSSFHSN